MKSFLCVLLIASSTFACAPNNNTPRPKPKPKPTPTCKPITTTRDQCVVYAKDAGENGDAKCGKLTATETTTSCDTAPFTTMAYHIPGDKGVAFGTLISINCVNGDWEFIDSDDIEGKQSDSPGIEIYCTDF